MDLNINCPTTVKKTLKANLLTKLSQSIWRKHRLMSLLALLMVFCIPVNRTNASSLTGDVSRFTGCLNSALEKAEKELDEMLMTSIYVYAVGCAVSPINRDPTEFYRMHTWGILWVLDLEIRDCIEHARKLQPPLKHPILWYPIPMYPVYPTPLNVIAETRRKQAALERKVADIASFRIDGFPRSCREVDSYLDRTLNRTFNRTTVETRLALWNKFVHNVSGKLTKVSKGNDVKIINLPNGKWAIKSSRNNKYLSSENGTKAMKFNRKSIGAWEEFSPQVKRINGKLSLALKASNGKSVIVKKGALWAKSKETKYIFSHR